MAARELGEIELRFRAPVIEWRGPAPYFYARVPPDESDTIAEFSRALTYGWGAIPVMAQIGATQFRTALFPKDGGYLLPLRADVRTREAIALADVVEVSLGLGWD
jgi:Domain of unknown function (DUF1905).